MSDRFRVFLSYSHSDRGLADGVAEALRQVNLEPIYDRHIRPGTAFTDSIKGLIAHAHIFMPLITEHARERPWVHQETGYAMALNIPVLPLAIGQLPGEMISQLQAVQVKPDLSDLPERLREINWEHIVMPPPSRSLAMVEVADWPEKRVEFMALYASRVLELGHHERVRQRGGLSSFSIPDADIEDPIWKARDGRFPRSDYYHHWLRQERQMLERHAREAGCDLLIDPTVETSGLADESRRVRLECVLAFLNSVSDDQVRIVCSPRARDANITIVGDWFIAESRLRLPGQGWRQTVFSWHAPTVVKAMRQFSQTFDALLRNDALTQENSRKAAIARIEAVLVQLQSSNGQSS